MEEKNNLLEEKKEKTNNISDENTEVKEEIHNETNSEEKMFCSEKQDITEEELFKFIGAKNLDYYAGIFKKNKKSENFASWNFASFLFTPFWLAYRKLYGWLAIFLAVSAVFEAADYISMGLGIILKIVLIVLFGIFGNCIYLSHCKKKIHKVKTELEDYKGKDKVLEANGGTSSVSIIVFFLVIIILVVLMVFCAVLLNSVASMGLLPFL